MPADVLLIDNYDSFVFNLSRYLEELGVSTLVERNDALTIEQIAALGVKAIILSPGPCTPAEAGVCVQVVRELGATIPILGVCLGHQAIGAAFGGRIVRAEEPVHGRTSLVSHHRSQLFAECEQPLQVARYHSLIVDSNGLPECLEVTAALADGTIMALSHRELPIYGVQFHPESILTRNGHRLLANFLQLAGIETNPIDPLGDLLEEDQGGNDFYRRAIDAEVFRPA